MQIEDVRWAFDQPRVGADEKRLGYFVTQRSLERKERVVVDLQHVGSNFGSFDLWPFVRLLYDHVFNDAHISQTIHGNHEWRMRREDDLVVGQKPFDDIAEQIALRLAMQSQAGLIKQDDGVSIASSLF